MNRHEEIKSAYRALGKEATTYDGMITCSTLLGKAVCRLVWDMEQMETVEYLTRALSGIPEDFSGSLLEVPVGTGVLTMPVYQGLPNASVTCLDYSEDMMSRAQKRAKRDGLTHVRFQQGDVGNLPFPDGSFDIVLSLNGFHAFPDKEAAYREVFRVLKPGGYFCGCFYIAGETARTDWFIRHLYEPKGYFTSPYETADSLKQRLERQYEA
ncbi:MAG: class I SAM-dependent methyltransferase, partial [Oscillospiraceae bacterium]|nr:class I SAM-dependent methyltransferase [Oscillospiraceae bacterium]